jgi:hypothetical protein
MEANSPPNSIRLELPGQLDASGRALIAIGEDDSTRFGGTETLPP